MVNSSAAIFTQYEKNLPFETKNSEIVENFSKEDKIFSFGKHEIPNFQIPEVTVQPQIDHNES